MDPIRPWGVPGGFYTALGGSSMDPLWPWAAPGTSGRVPYESFMAQGIPYRSHMSQGSLWLPHLPPVLVC